MTTKMCKCKQRPAKWLAKNRKWLCDECAKEAGMLVPCHGEAHSNPFIDNCGVCAPRWEWVEVVPAKQDLGFGPKPLDLDKMTIEELGQFWLEAEHYLRGLPEWARWREAVEPVE